MEIIYTKAEIHDVMQYHFERTHIGPTDKLRIENMTLSPNQVTIELGPEPADEDKS